MPKFPLSDGSANTSAAANAFHLAAPVTRPNHTTRAPRFQPGSHNQRAEQRLLWPVFLKIVGIEGSVRLHDVRDVSSTGGTGGMDERDLEHDVGAHQVEPAGLRPQPLAQRRGVPVMAWGASREPVYRQVGPPLRDVIGGRR